MIRTNIMLSENLIKKLDAIAKEVQKSRSTLLREAAQRFIEEYQRVQEEQKKKEKARKAAQLQDKLREKAGKWDGVLEVRRWREIRK